MRRASFVRFIRGRDVRTDTAHQPTAQEAHHRPLMMHLHSDSRTHTKSRTEISDETLAIADAAKTSHHELRCFRGDATPPPMNSRTDRREFRLLGKACERGSTLR